MVKAAFSILKLLFFLNVIGHNRHTAFGCGLDCRKANSNGLRSLVNVARGMLIVNDAIYHFLDFSRNVVVEGLYLDYIFGVEMLTVVGNDVTVKVNFTRIGVMNYRSSASSEYGYGEHIGLLSADGAENLTYSAAGKLHNCHRGIVYGPIGENLLSREGANLLGIAHHPTHKLDCVTTAANNAVTKLYGILTPNRLKILIIVSILGFKAEYLA